MDLVKFVERELDIIGMPEGDGDEKNVWMRKNILEIAWVFSQQGHDNLSADYAVSLLQHVLLLQPLSPLTGDDSEWREVEIKEPRDISGGKLYQNLRCGRVFKDNNGAYDLEGKVFYEVKKDENGVEYKDCYITPECRTSIQFPYVPTSVFEERARDVKIKEAEVTVVKQSPTVH